MLPATELLHLAAAGDRQAANDLIPLVYGELRNLAGRLLVHEKPGQTLQPTALVHEAFLRLTGDADAPRWDNRGHFFAAAAIAMRRVLVESARRKGRQKRGGGMLAVELDDVPELPVDDQLLAVDEALTRLSQEDAEGAKIVELRYFAGLTIEQVIETTGMTEYAVKQKWAYARAWLQAELAPEE
jgi:RNA polymerase sigma factor (TIGR02999 family)